jgi:hypothetical protein
MKLGGVLEEEGKNEKNRVMTYTGCQGQCLSDPPALPLAGVTEGEQFFVLRPLFTCLKHIVVMLYLS